MWALWYPLLGHMSVPNAWTPRNMGNRNICQCIGYNALDTPDTLHRDMWAAWHRSIWLYATYARPPDTEPHGDYATDYAITWTYCNLNKHNITKATETVHQVMRALGYLALDCVSHLDTKQYEQVQYIQPDTRHRIVWNFGYLSSDYVGTGTPINTIECNIYRGNEICEHHRYPRNGTCEHHGYLSMEHVSIMDTYQRNMRASWIPINGTCEHHGYLTTGYVGTSLPFKGLCEHNRYPATGHVSIMDIQQRDMWA